MKLRHALLALSLVMPLGLLISNGCGIIASPVEGPKIAVVNSKLIAFTTDVIDENGVPLNGVTAHVMRHALTSDVFYTEMEEENREPDVIFDKTFSYSHFGQYAVVVTFSKPGFESSTRVYSFEDHVAVGHNASGGGALDMQHVTLTFPADSYINTFKQPHTSVMLKQNVSTRPD